MRFPIDEAVFPTDISYGSSGGPEFSTEVVVLGDGSERRNQRWEQPRSRWNVAYGVKAAEQLDALMTFFWARQGRARGFLFFDHRDHSVFLQSLGVGGTEDVRDFQFVR